MKTSEQVKEEIARMVGLFNAGKTQNTLKKDLGRINFLRNCQLYLETLPSEEFIMKESERLQAGIKHAEEQYEVHYSRVRDAKFKADYLEENFEYKKRKSQLEIIEYCLA